MRQYSLLDRTIGHVDRALRTVDGRLPGSGREYPPERLPSIPEAAVASRDRRRSARLMRVNHAGEVAAQALYQGQALTCRNRRLAKALEQAAIEEVDHLHWCERRIQELGGRTSRLDGFWYAGALSIGALAGALGDRVNLGFLAETERQVVQHLDGHLARLPEQDRRSRAILEQMRVDEQAHQLHAQSRGGLRLPRPVRQLMRLGSKVMTKGAFWV
ncbi:MAG: 2-polyprenyl-3-methyl-6-methoxy-1,4-benzoquinone monooxygenase [Gammaproteobacteria bacterium]|nr:2-polyprenyl-3-methyl-6-methoxy-1,4-benzoquinone monooxygenase [Gammaproteobacteria bacterium]